MSIIDLPNETLAWIIAQISVEDHFALFSTCKYFYNRSQNRAFLESLFMFRMGMIFGKSLSQLNEREILHIYNLEKDYMNKCWMDDRQCHNHLLKIFSENGYDIFVVHHIENIKLKPRKTLHVKLRCTNLLGYFDLYDQLLFENKDVKIKTEYYSIALKRCIKTNNAELLDRFMVQKFHNDIDKQL